ncbi:lytic transglycosylase domain-containing protein [Streptomyces sp. NPDC060194]|uniref:lytic transglycosylase domain-containing protein n=1 Tax=Streptomyces sp. NPDC060194 TaxID=3347069 RepID=UPI00365F373F
MAAQFGRRLRRGAVSTTVAAVAVAALSASQAPGVTGSPRDVPQSNGAADQAAEDTATGNSPYYTDLPQLTTPDKPESSVDLPGATTPAGSPEAGIPATVLDAYKRAEATVKQTDPGCNLPWQLLAAIGKVESGQARGGAVNAEGTTTEAILGPQLNGQGFANISDTDGGAYDGDTTHDRAVGPMQFIPSTWATSGRDGNGDGTKDPNNVYDAALAAGYYLCANGRDLSDPGDLRKAILSYNNSSEYVNTVMTWLEFYRTGSHEVPDGTGVLPEDRSDAPAPGTPSPSPAPVTQAPTSPPATTPPPSTPGTSPSRPGTPSPPPGTTPPPSPSPTPTPDPSEPPLTPTQSVAALRDAGTGTLAAVAGERLAVAPKVRAVNAKGGPVAKVRVRFTITGATGTAFAGGETVAVAVTGTDGLAAAPALTAGPKDGAFTVRAVVIGRTLTPVTHQGTVLAPVADTLARIGTDELTCPAGEAFAAPVTVAATYRGNGVAGTSVAVAVLDAKGEPAVVGPYFEGPDGKPLRTLAGLRTDAKGRLQLPELFAGEAAGTFAIRLTTGGGVVATVPVTVTAAKPTTPPDGGGTPAPGGGGSASPSASPSASASQAG